MTEPVWQRIAGKIAAQCCHATLGAYKRAVKRTPNAVKAWEMLGQAKVCVKVDSEEEMLALAKKAADNGLIHYIVVRMALYNQSTAA